MLFNKQALYFAHLGKGLTDSLLQLTKIFPKGFTVIYQEGVLQPYNNIKYNYIVSYKTLIKISEQAMTIFQDLYPVIKEGSIIGYWEDNHRVGWLELNKAFKSKRQAVIFGKKNKQEFIYNFKTGGCIKCK